MRLTTSPIPIGLIPGHLSMEISLQAISGCRGSGSTNLELILLAVLVCVCVLFLMLLFLKYLATSTCCSYMHMKIVRGVDSCMLGVDHVSCQFAHCTQKGYCACSSVLSASWDTKQVISHPHNHLMERLAREPNVDS